LKKPEKIEKRSAQKVAARYGNFTQPEDRATLGINLNDKSMPKASAACVEGESVRPGEYHLPLARIR
jgi:hypothetical protein